MVTFLKDIADKFVAELKAITKDEGVILFFVLLPLSYPLLYSWIYNNEVVREVPVVIVDDSHSALSREFIQKFDASPDVSVAYYCRDIAEGRDVIGRGEAYGIVYFPDDFSTNVGRMKQSHVSVYCDMSYMLTYKAIFTTATTVSQKLGGAIRTQLINPQTDRDAELSAAPLEVDDVPIFNVTGGYGNFVLPGVLVLIVHQALLLGVGMISGTERDRKYVNYRHDSSSTTMRHAWVMFFGKVFCYYVIFAVMLAYVALVIPKIFGFVSLVHALDISVFLAVYLLDCVLFAITFSEVVRNRESVMIMVVFMSLPLLFGAGLSWPQSNAPTYLQGIVKIFPSTFGIRGFVRMSSMGARLCDITVELKDLCVIIPIYFCTALFAIWRRVKFAE